MLPAAPLAAFAEFGRHMLDSADIDPIYPVLRQLISDLNLSTAQAEWLTVLYLAYYEVTSALEAFDRYPHPTLGEPMTRDRDTLKLPTGIERRGLRDPEAMREHLLDWVARFDGDGFLNPALQLLGDDPRRNDSILDTYVRGVKFNGRWAAYKACEVFHKVLGTPNEARDAGHEGSTGPRQGLTLFFPEVKGNRPVDLNLLDYQTDVLMRATAAHGVELAVEEVETLLCDFKSLVRGRYYVGHDTDLMLEGILRPGVEDQIRYALLLARRALPEHYRGEGGRPPFNRVGMRWLGRDKNAMRAYVERGEVLHRLPPRGAWAT